MDESAGIEVPLVFPCDARGCVCLDSLPNDVRNEYFFARAAVGVEYAGPTIESCGVH